MARNQKLTPKANLKLNANVDVWGWKADEIPTYEDYLRIKNSNKLDDYAIYHDRGRNLIVNAGLNQVVNLMVGVNTSSFTYSSVGSGSTVVTSDNTDLQTVIGSRLAITSRYIGTTGVAHFDTFYNSSANNGTWNEAGIFDASSSGDMLARKIISTFTKSSTNTATVAWTVTLTAV